MDDACLIITTGGTIDKVYFDAKSDYAVGEPQIGEVLRQAHVDLPHRVDALMRKDSLDMTAGDRQLIRHAVEAAAERMVLVTHGTDTMTVTAEALKGIPGKVIVLTGALLPARFRDNDAVFNIGFALAAVQALPPGVHIAMNGRLHDPRRVRKDRDLNRFVAVGGDRAKTED
jgi:L-asparaginase